MTPYIFSSHDSRKEKDAQSSVRMTLRFAGRHIFPSLLLAEFLNIRGGSRVVFMCDDDAPSKVYIRAANDDDTWTTKVSAKETSNKLQMSAKAVVGHVLRITGAEKSVTLFVSPRPVRVEGNTFYRILTDNPYVIK